MRVQVTKMLEIVKLLLVFALLTFFFYGLIVWIVDQLENRHLDEKPKGNVVQVFNSSGEETADHLRDMKDRLLFYYWFGE